MKGIMNWKLGAALALVGAVIVTLALIAPSPAPAALSANALVNTFENPEIKSYGVAASAHIYRGALVGRNPAGYIKPMVPGDMFVGVAYEEKTGTATAGAVTCRVKVGTEISYTLTSVAVTDVGKPVFATADDAISTSGHPDAYVGRITGYLTTNTAKIQTKRPGERPPNGVGSIDMDIDFSQVAHATVDESAALLVAPGLKYNCAGAGLTAGTTGVLRDESTGELEFLIDNDNEAQNITVETPQIFNVTKGVTFEFEGRLKTAGGAATDDMDFGVMGLSGGITATERANMNATTSGLISALFHLDANANDVFASSDDNASPVTAADTTVDNSLTVNKRFKIIVRPTGSVEVWVNETQYLSTTAFSVGSSGLLAGIVNMEKSTGTGVPEVRIRKLRVAGAFN